MIADILQAWPDARVKSIEPIEPTEQEINAMLSASEPAGSYLERIGKSDMATLSEDEWMCFIETIVVAFQLSMAASYAPYALVRSVDDPMAAECPF